MKKAIYTCVTGGYDNLDDSTDKIEGWDYICFTDKPEQCQSKLWKFEAIPCDLSNNLRRSRYVKLRPHEVLYEYDYSLYIDSNIAIKDNSLEKRLVELIGKECLISIAKHPERDCIYDEAKICIEEQLDNKGLINKQIEFLKSQGFPEHYGLFENNIIFREHNDPRIIELNNKWWDIYMKFSKRDQLSLAFLLWSNKIHCEPLFEDRFNVRNSELFRYKNHKNRTGSTLLNLKAFFKKCVRLK